jgi:uncharacterized protein (DUF1501 family)
MSAMDRRKFLLGLGALGAAATAGTSAFLIRPRSARADGLPTAFGRKLVNLTLNGGPDFRHLIVPKPATSDPNAYGYSYWKYRATSHYIDGNKPDTWQSRYDSDYDHVTSIGGVAVPEFGILKLAGWLKDQIVAGNVAIVANVKHSENRDHAHSLLRLESGDLTTTAFATDRDGWGGRLADAIGGNVFSMTRQRLLFANLPKGSKSQIISARDTRKFGLVKSTATDWKEGSKAVSDRALSSYYAAKRGSIDPSSPHAQFVQTERLLRDFSNAVQSRLGSNAVPAAIAGLFSGDTPTLKRNPNFGEEMRNVYDCLACEDLKSAGGAPFGFRVGSLDYGGWDSHKNQRDQIEPQFAEIFGAGGGFDVLHKSVAADMSGALSKVVFTAAGEFGRQLHSNGDRGTDHGRGNLVFVFGDSVKGGIYGELFPMEEITTKVDGLNSYEAFNRDIKGKTAFDRVFGAVADWVGESDTTGDAVFPDRATSPIEASVTLTRSSLFKTP